MQAHHGPAALAQTAQRVVDVQRGAIGFEHVELGVKGSVRRVIPPEPLYQPIKTGKGCPAIPLSPCLSFSLSRAREDPQWYGQRGSLHST
jgi:hypothetical protein